MDLQDFVQNVSNATISTPIIKQGQKVKGVVIKKITKGVLVDCENGSFTTILLPKEIKELEKNGFNVIIGMELEAEILNLDYIDEEGYYVISISKLLQYDIWKNIKEKCQANEIINVVPTEANLGGLLVDMHGIKGFIPLSQLAPVHYPRVEDGDQEKIFEVLLSLIGKTFSVRIINIDEEGKRMILSEREALKEEKERIMNSLAIGDEFEGIISGVSSYGLFVTIGGGIEGLVHISEITYGHVDQIEKFGKVGDTISVKVIGLDNTKISLSLKKLRPDPWSLIPGNFKIGDILEGEVVRFVPYGAFIRVFEDINGLVHLSEIIDKPISNPAEALKLGQKVQAKIILIDIDNRRIGMSIKGVYSTETTNPEGSSDNPQLTGSDYQPTLRPKNPNYTYQNFKPVIKKKKDINIEKIEEKSENTDTNS